MMEFALDYARRGLPVFPCSPRNKAPYHQGGFQNATTDSETITKWWTDYPYAMIGVPMGRCSGLWAIDPDPPKNEGDPDGRAIWKELVEKHGVLPTTHTEGTPRGGAHILFKWDADRPVTNSPGALKGTNIDVRGEGGYVIMAPSECKGDGSRKNVAGKYLLGENRFQFADAPDWVFDLVLQPEPVAAQATQTKTGNLLSAFPKPASSEFWRKVNSAALENVMAWAPSAFPQGSFEPGTGAWRVSSQALGRDLEEDLSVSPKGVKDWGVWDQGDSRQGRRSAIGLLIEHRIRPNAVEAAHWLCERMGVDPVTFGWEGGRHGNDNHAGAGGAGPGGIRFLSYAEMAAMPAAEWLVDGVIQRQSAALAFGKSNSFKSFIAIDIGLSVSAGMAWHGNAVKRGDVVFVATEGGNGVGRLRIPAWYDHHKVPVEKRRAFLYPREIRLDIDADITELIRELKARGNFALIVLDIFGGTMSGSEVEDKTARAWVHGVQRILRETGASILAIAHTGWQDDTRARMHTHFWGSFDSRLRVEGDKDALTATLTVERHKDADSSGSWGFRMSPAGDSLVPTLDGTVKTSKTRTLSGHQRVAVNALDDALMEHGVRKNGPHWPACKVVEIEKWRAACDRHGLASGDNADTRGKAFRRARSALMDRSIIRILDGFVWLVSGDRTEPGRTRTNPDMSGFVR